jgi:hypothetical protein
MSGPNPDAVSIDAIITALYESISAPPGACSGARPRAPRAGALMIPMRPPSVTKDGRGAAEILDVDGYEKSRAPFFAANSFYEVEIARREFHFGAMAHVLSVYEGRDAPNGTILKRGINSIQLFHDGARWWVASIMWDNERDGVALPEEFGVYPKPSSRVAERGRGRGTPSEGEEADSRPSARHGGEGSGCTGAEG